MTPTPEAVPLSDRVAVPDALAYSRNYAAATPYLTATGREHINGLCNLLEQVSAERDRLRAAHIGVDAVIAKLDDEILSMQVFGIAPKIIAYMKGIRDELEAALPAKGE